MWIRPPAFPGQKTPRTLIHSTSHHTFATVGWIKRLSAGLLGGKRIHNYKTDLYNQGPEEYRFFPACFRVFFIIVQYQVKLSNLPFGPPGQAVRTGRIPVLKPGIPAKAGLINSIRVAWTNFVCPCSQHADTNYTDKRVCPCHHEELLLVQSCFAPLIGEK